MTPIPTIIFAYPSPSPNVATEDRGSGGMPLGSAWMKGAVRMARALDNRLNRAPIAAPDVGYLAEWASAVRSALGDQTEICWLSTEPGARPDIPLSRIITLGARSLSQAIVDELKGRPFDRAVRISVGEIPDPAKLRALAATLEANPDAIVFSDYDRLGNFIADAFTAKAFKETEAFNWTRATVSPQAVRTEYFQARTIPRTVRCVTFGADKEELEGIVACRHWFNPVRIRNRWTYCSEKYDYLLDPFLLNPEHRFFQDQSVLEVGCWEGALGSQALEAGARSVHFTDSRLRDLDWRFPYPTKHLSRDCYDKSVGEAIGSLPFVLAHRDPQRVKFTHANVYTLEHDVGSQAYDVTIFGGILYHIYDPMLAIRQICNVTRASVVLGTWVLGGRVAIAYLQDALESDSHDTTTWFYMSFPMLKSLFNFNGFHHAVMLGGNTRPFLDGSDKDLQYRYMVFSRVPV